jgi:type I restriction enzyme S subunit
LKVQEPEIVRLQQTGSIPALNKAQLAKVVVPIPPIDQQREIVRILDLFTELEAELEADIEVRRRQYVLYVSDAFAPVSGAPTVSIGQVAEIRSGWAFPNAEQGRREGDIPFYKVSDMNLPGNETVMHRSNNYVSTSTTARLGIRLAPAGTVIFPKIGAAVATNKKRLLSRPSAYDNNVMGLIPRPGLHPRYLYYWMQNFDLRSLAHDSGAVPSIRKSEAEEVRIHVPELAVQTQVVELLDKFDALVNDLSVGLPAELAARRKQYEYYRDKLLTFPEAS